MSRKKKETDEKDRHIRSVNR